ncbi:hypothetical protein FRB95_001201 [Tulasnella sp. JGI-2019a]|nr:hypothetical protein FRB95_001201 [Tulasnella sp. JGI-2019a]
MATPPPLEHDQPTTVILLPPTSEPPFVPYGLGPMPFLPPTSEPLYTPAVSSTSGPLVMPFVPPTHEVPFFLSTSGSFVTTEKSDDLITLKSQKR